MPDEIASLEVAGLTLTNWEALTINRSLDEVVSSFSFSSPFDPDNRALRDAFRPFGYQSAKIKLDGDLLFVGRVEQPAVSIDASGARINIEGRSPAGAMLDCAFEPPYQFDGQTWGAIADKLCAPFGVTVDKTTDTRAIKIAKASTGDSPAAFLADLAKGEGLIMTSSPSGALRLQRIVRSVPIASIVEGVGSFVSASLTANGTARFSRTKAIKSMGDWKPVEAVSVDSAIKIYRPRIITSDGDAQSIQSAADLARSQSIAESCPVEVVVTGWKTDAGRVWTPGDFVSLKAPSAWIIRETVFVVSAVALELTTGGRSTTLTLCLPEAYLGGVPSRYPWDDQGGAA